MKETKFKKGLFFIVTILSFCYLVNFLVSIFSENIILTEFLKTEGYYIFFWLTLFIISINYTIGYLKKK